MRSTTLAATVTATLALGCAVPAHADQAQTDAQIRDLVAQVQALRGEVEQLRAAQSQAAVVPPATAPSADLAAPATMAREASPLTFTGYGEAVYTRPSEGPEDAIADLTRVVFGAGYQFDDKTRVEIEAEWEHAITSADDDGEAAIEQAYISREIDDSMQFQAGLFLIPMGIINERHEPPTFFGVFRPLTETAIIPSTWREGGLALLGNTESGLTWGLGVTTGFNLADWDPTSIDGQESPLGSIHQELSFAVANDLSAFGSVRYTGAPGLTLGAAVFTGGAGQGQQAFPAEDSQATLWSAYARWTPGNWQLTALYAEGYLTDTAALNRMFIGNPTPVPERFWGGYGQVAYRGWTMRTWQFEPFVRYEQVNTGAQYANLGQGLTPRSLETETVTTLGASLYATPNVVFKMDYQFYESTDATLGYEDRLNLGVGYMY